MPYGFAKDSYDNRVIGDSYLVDVNNHTGYAQVVEKRVNEGAGFELEASYVYGHDLISQTLHPTTQNPGPSTQTYWYLYDGHGTVRALADETGAVTDEYEAFGVLLTPITQNPKPNTYLYTGEQYDADLGMYFLRARYLNTQSGRFHNMDTYQGRNGEPLTLHKYVYGHQNPVMNLDPSGNLSLLSTAQTVAVIGTLTAISGVAISSAGLASAMADEDGLPDAYIFSVAGVASSRGVSASIGLDIIYHVKSNKFYAYTPFAIGLAPSLTSRTSGILLAHLSLVDRSGI